MGQAEGEGKMTDEPHLPRFLVRRGAKRGWMVWDRHAKGAAEYQGQVMSNYSKSKRGKLETN
jgi:hypothetical protein